MTMPALTVWQPWASLIIAGLKPYEFRRWPAPAGVCGKRIAIHAGARKVNVAEVRALCVQLRRDGGFGTALDVAPALALLERLTLAPTMLPLSSVLGTAILGQPRRAVELFGRSVNDSDRIDHAMWAWPLTDVRPLEPIAPARGAQGFWPWDERRAA